MKTLKTSLAIISSLLILITTQVQAADAVSTVGVGGFDLVSYHNSKKPLPGNGHHVVQHEGVSYLFSSKENANTFKNNKEKYLPAYGGFCAYGAAVGKKFISDPTVWEVVDGKLYLNLDNSIKNIWQKDVSANIKKADKNWRRIKDVPADKL